MSVIENLFSQDEIAYLTQLPEVAAAAARINQASQNSMVYFSIPLTETIRATLESRLGLNLAAVSEIPMRWIKGDMAPHVDVGRSAFDQTFLAYLNDSPGQLVLDNTAYPITANTAFTFSEGISHATIDTGSEPRLLVGPMNELAQPVGAPLLYYPTETDALNGTNLLGGSGSFTVGDGGPFGGYTRWRIASNSSGSSPQNVVYSNGDVLNADGGYYLYPAAPCFLEGTKILCQVDGKETYVPIEKMKPGTLVKTSRDGFKKLELIGKAKMQNPGTDKRIQGRLYKCSPSRYPELIEDLYITGCHSVLVDTITDTQRKETVKQLGKVFITDRKYRLMACVDERAKPWTSEGSYTIWHFALENADPKMNYGVYANGLLVETCSLNFMKNKSNMTLVE